MTFKKNNHCLRRLPSFRQIITNYTYCFLLSVSFFLFAVTVQAQHIKEMRLPANISGINEEFSGITIWQNRLYLLPQYGSHKETLLDKEFFIYSIATDSIIRVIQNKDSSLAKYRTLSVKNLDRLPDSIKKHYQGFEAIAVTDSKIFLTLEMDDESDSGYVLAGKINLIKKEIITYPEKIKALKRFSYIDNASFESLTFLPMQNKLLVVDEFNSSSYGSKGYLLDTGLRYKPQVVNMPFLYFRLTDIAAAGNTVYGLNYYWNGDYDRYLNNLMIRHAEQDIQDSIPALKPYLLADSNYLNKKTTCYARIVKLKKYNSAKWEQVLQIENACSSQNWEGLVPFHKGFLVISDANREKFLKTTLLYIEK